MGDFLTGVGNFFSFGDASTSIAAGAIANSGTAAQITAIDREMSASLGIPPTNTPSTNNLIPGSDGTRQEEMTPNQLNAIMGNKLLEKDKTSFADIAIALSPIAIGIMNAKNAKKENEKDREAAEQLQDDRINAELLNQQRAQEHANSLATMQANFQLRNAVQQVKQIAGPGVSIGGSRNVIRDRNKGA